MSGRLTIGEPRMPQQAASFPPRWQPRLGSERAAIAVGGALGAWARMIIEQQAGWSGSGWPWATFLVNVAGSFLLGFFIAQLLERLPPSIYHRPLLGTGFCGALTTFATLQYETLILIQRGHELLAAAYAATSAGASFGALVIAIWLVRRVRFA